MIQQFKLDADEVTLALDTGETIEAFIEFTVDAEFEAGEPRTRTYPGTADAYHIRGVVLTRIVGEHGEISPDRAVWGDIHDHIPNIEVRLAERVRRGEVLPCR